MAEEEKKNQNPRPERIEKKNGKPGIFSRIKKSFSDMKGEMKKVVWPSKKQIVNNTGVVLAAVAVSGVFIWALDAVLSLAIRMFFSLV